MYLIVGLGNPEDKYIGSRHNVGFMFVDAFAATKTHDPWLMDRKSNSLVIKHQPHAIFAKPQTFMNKSGLAVRNLVTYYKLSLSNLLVIHDDLDLKLGDYKVHLGRGPKVHGGINSIEGHLNSKDFWRVRIGIENRELDNKIPGESYVLQPFSKEEEKIITGVIDEAIRHLNEQLK